MSHPYRAGADFITIEPHRSLDADLLEPGVPNSGEPPAPIARSIDTYPALYVLLAGKLALIAIAALFLFLGIPKNG